ncbi:hypothetical protein BIW11_10815, partial [Tropilaelaps mercedesae]
NSQALQGCKALLEVHSKRLGRPSVTNDPVKQFGLQQIHLVCREFLKKIEMQMISLTDFETDISNLIYFRRYCARVLTPGTLFAFVTQIQLLMCSIGEVVNILEKVAGLPIRDWRECGSKLSDQAVLEDKGLSFCYKDYIPFRKDFDCPELIGFGSHVNVYKVRHIPTSTYMAMKITRRTKFQGINELCYVDKACAGILSDPGMIKTHCAFMAQPDVCIVLMDIGATRQPLLDIVNNEGYLNDRCVSMITMQIVLTLEYIHLNGFIHRDLEPSNVLVDHTCHIKLIDFDLAKVCIGHYSPKVMHLYFKRTSNEFQDGERCGKMAYTAPEVLLKRSYGRAIDWWSLGCVVFKMSTGTTPFRNSNPAALAKAIKTNEVRWPKAKHSAEIDTKEFVYDLLKKKPLIRLGSKIYSDVKFHKYMMRARQYVLELESSPRSSPKDPVFDQRNDSKQLIFCNKILVNMTPVFRKLASAGTGQKMIPQENVTFAMLADEAHSNHISLATFAHFKFRKLIDRLNEPGIMRKVSEFLGADTPPQDELNYLKLKLWS